MKDLTLLYQVCFVMDNIYTLEPVLYMFLFNEILNIIDLVFISFPALACLNLVQLS